MLWLGEMGAAPGAAPPVSNGRATSRFGRPRLAGTTAGGLAGSIPAAPQDWREESRDGADATDEQVGPRRTVGDSPCPPRVARCAGPGEPEIPRTIWLHFYCLRHGEEH